MISPIVDYKITSPYGKRILKGKEQFHDGIDFISKSDDRTVRVITEGTILMDIDYYEESKRWTDARHSAGNYLIIQHVIDDKKYFCRYFHLGENFVSKGDKVAEGQAIGIYADAGISYGAHLHFDMYDSAWKKIDPTFLIDKF